MLLHGTPCHSHSIVLSDSNALIFQGNFFSTRRRTVSLIRQKFPLLNSNEISPIPNPLGFTNYRYQSVDFFVVPRAGCRAISAKKDRQQKQCMPDVRTSNNGGAAWRWRIESRGRLRLPTGARQGHDAVGPHASPMIIGPTHPSPSSVLLRTALAGASP
jgi:hypothetical protein